MNQSHEISLAIKLLYELRDIYSKEGGENFLPGIESAIDWLTNKNYSQEEKCANACSIYINMASTKCGFSEFYIDGSTVDERVHKNKKLDEIRESLWNIIFGWKK